MKQLLLFCILLGILFLYNCNKKEVIVYYAAEDRFSSSSIQSKASFTSKPKISWNKPKNWLKIPAGNMQLAKFLFNKDRTEDNVSIASFPGDVGGILQNVNRWRRQLSLPPTTMDKVKLKEYKGKYLNFKIVRVLTKSKSIIVAFFKKQGQTTFIKMTLSHYHSAKQKENEFLKFCYTIKQI